MYEIQFNDLKRDLNRFGLSYRREVFHLATAKEVCDVIKHLPKDVLFTLREYDLDSVDDVLCNFKVIEV